MDIKNCVFYGKTISVYGSSYLYVNNSIFWNASNFEFFLGNSWSPAATLHINYSDIRGGQGSIKIDTPSTLIWGPGMISSDPLFVDPAAYDYHLTHPSPCRDTGDNSVKKLPPLDFEGDPRISFGTVDMGADEFFYHLYHAGDATPGGAITLNLIGLPKSVPVILWLGSGVLDPPIHLPKYGYWYLQSPLLLEVGLGSIPAPYGLLILPIVIPPDVPVPLDLPLQALVGSTLTNLYKLKILP